MARAYKDRKVYGCLILNRLASELDLDLHQPELSGKLDQILSSPPPGLSKEEVKHEIRSNHFMTNRILEDLESEGLVSIDKVDGRYAITITRDGVLYIRKYNEFYLKIYREQIRDHYRYSGVPHWAREVEK